MKALPRTRDSFLMEVSQKDREILVGVQMAVAIKKHTSFCVSKNSRTNQIRKKYQIRWSFNADISCPWNTTAQALQMLQNDLQDLTAQLRGSM